MFEVIDKLEALCDQRRPATLTAGQPGVILKGRFRFCSSSSGFVVIELLDLPAEASIPERTPCTVVFADGARSTLFISEVLAIETEGHRFPVLRVRIPQTTVRTEARSNFRIPLDDGARLRVEVVNLDRHWNPRPVDISIAGMLVELPPGERFPVAALEELEIRIQRNGSTATLAGFAQHRWGSFWALYFSDVLRSLRHGCPEVPGDLRLIFDAVEADWLNRH